MNDNIKQIIEGILFLSGSNGITIGELVSIINIDQMTIEQNINDLKKDFENRDSALTIIQTVQTYKMSTTAKNTSYYQKYTEQVFNDKLSSSALETLSIIAYNQPITRFDIEEKRGVGVGHNLKLLQVRDLIKVIGKSKEIGHPHLYGTTTNFLDFLGLNSLEQLPPLSTFKLEADNNELEIFSSVEDFKEIKKRLLTSDNIIEVDTTSIEDNIDNIEIKDITLELPKEETNE